MYKSFTKLNLNNSFKKVKPVSIRTLPPTLRNIFRKRILKSVLFLSWLILITFIFLFCNKEIFFLSLDKVTTKVFLYWNINKFSLFLFLTSIDNYQICFELLRPLILQFNKELSLLIDEEVEMIQSYLDLSRWPTFLDLLFVIHCEFLLIV